MKKIYLDHNSTTPLHPEVKKAMEPYGETIFGNASSLHYFGREARKAVDQARINLAKLISAKKEREIIFTSGGTESDNTAIKGMAWALKEKGNHIVTSKIEHHAVLESAHFLEKFGFKTTYLSCDKYGIVDLEELKRSITDKTILISIMWANNEVGTIEPISQIAQIARERGIYFHTDAVQAVGKIPIDLSKSGVDLLSLSAHKFYGPKGVGALYIREGVKIEPLSHGGSHERNLRAGTENVAGIVGLGKAAQLALKDMDKESKNLIYLRDKLHKKISEKIELVHLNGHPSQRLPNTLNISFEGIEGESIILNLDLQGVACSTGSACTSGGIEPSHVLLALGIVPRIAQGAIRFSLGRINTEEEIDYVVKVLVPIVEKLRKMSPLYK